MNSSELASRLRTVIARLEMVSTAPVARLDRDTMGGDGNGVSERSPAEHYTRWLQSIDAGLQRRLNGCEALGDVHERKAALIKAQEWWHDCRVQVLEAAEGELARLTGHDGKQPERREAGLDTQKGIEDAIREDAPGKPADVVAARLGVSKFIARRVYVIERLDPHDGMPVGTDAQERNRRIAEFHERGYGERQIAMLMGVARDTVRRALGRAA